MKRKARIGVFETNSSSVHSLAFAQDGREGSTLKVNPKDGMIEVGYGRFDTDLCYYTSQQDKLSYLMTCLYYLCGYSTEGIYDNYEFDCIQRAVCKYTGAPGIRIVEGEEPYINHQSQPYSEIEIINACDEEAVIDFVFNRHIMLKTDCD